MTSQNDHDLLIELNVKMDVLTSQLATHVTSSERSHADHNNRIRVLEQWKWRWAGALALLVFVWNLLSREILLRLVGQ